MKTEKATAQDIPELLDFVHNTFRADNPEHPRFEVLYPDLFLPPDEKASRHLIIRQNGKIISCVGSYPMTVMIAGCKVVVGGIGQVSTAPEMKGRGCMSQLLVDSIARMERDGVALSWLGGRHDRYGRYGWETVGTDFTYHYHGSAVRHFNESLLVTQSLGRETVISETMFAMRKQATTVEDAPENYQARLGRGGSEVWVAHPKNAEEPVAWGVVFPKARQIADFCGSVEGVVQIVKSAAFRLGSIDLCVSAADRGLNERLRMECAYMGFSAKSLLIVSLKNTLEQFGPLLVGRLPVGFGVTLKMSREDGSCEQVDLGAGGTVVELDRKRMARLLFGPERATDVPGVSPALTELNTLFPLPFTLPELFHV